MSAGEEPRSGRVDSPAVWHDAECGSYAADLGVWEELAARAPGPVVELGAGTGRVSLHLAARGFEVTAVDSEEALLAALAERAAERDLQVHTLRADARDFYLPGPAGLIIAPMQFALLMGGADGRARLFSAVERTLASGGVFSAALIDENDPPGVGPVEPLPDVREVEGWVHSSLPVNVVSEPGWLEIHRLRQLVSPAGEMSEAYDVVRLDRIGADDFLLEAQRAGLRPLARQRIPGTDDHVGSVVVTMERSR